MFSIPGSAQIEMLAPPPRPKSAALVCRRIVEGDIEDAIALLARGFPERSPGYWRLGLSRLRDRQVPEGYPRYGYVIADGAQLVGIILLVFATTDTGAVRGNVSSWYVDPTYRSFSHLLLSAPLKLKGATLFNISPAPSTTDTIQVQGFTKYASGAFLALAALSRPVPGARVRRIRAGQDATLLSDHARLGCLCFEVEHDGRTYPFAFAPTKTWGDRLPAAQLVYCRELEDVVRFAGPLGRRLLLQGLPVVLVDANAPLAGLPGLYRAGRGRRFYRGPERPRIGDLSYSELVLFGP